MIDIDNIRDITMTAIGDEVEPLCDFIRMKVHEAASKGKWYVRINRNYGKNISTSAWIAVLSELVHDEFMVKQSKEFYYISWAENYIRDRLKFPEK